MSPDQYERLAILVAQESAEVKAHLRSIDGRLAGIDARFDGVDGRLDGLDGRLTRVEVSGEQRGHLLEIVAERLMAVDQKVDNLRTDMNGNFAQLRQEMAVGFGAHDARLRKLEIGSTA
ncbi:MAG: hypothetical protein O2992_12890 [Gemmatimonadetes bacterium]|nr:hypothetical protein [Gemmatimonadota bacterium]